jgi:multiple sugar transport system substrate-binding protein
MTRSVSRRSFISGGIKGGALLAGSAALSPLISACSSSSGSPATSGSGESTTLTVEIDEGQNAEPFMWFNADMKRAVGVSTTIAGLPFVGQYEKIVAELVARSSAYDVLVFPPYFMGDFVAKGFLRKLTDFGPESAFDLPDVLPVYRDPYLKRNGDLYAANYDGDVLMLTYRTDVFDRHGIKSPPATWDEYLSIARELHNPPHMYGNAFYGQRGFCYAWFMNIFAAYGGKWFDSKMNPQINNDLGVKALELLIELNKYAPPDELAIGYPQLNQVFLNGSTAMVIQWDDLPLKTESAALGSKVIGKSGYAPCPVRSYMPYSRVMAISAYSANPHNSWKAIQYMNRSSVSVKDVYDPGCGEDPFRASQLDPSLVKDHTGQPTMPPALAAAYVSAIRGCLAGGYPELSIPGAFHYLDTLDLFVNEALAGQISAASALNAAASEWNTITQSLGQGAQEAAYNAWIQSFLAAGVSY